MKIRKYNLHEDRQLYAMLKEAPILKSLAAEHPGWKPEEKWTGPYAKYETLLKQFQAKPFPLAFGKQAGYEMLVGNDYINFFEDGHAYSTNNSLRMGYGMLPEYPKPSIVLFTDEGKTKKTDPIEGHISLEGGKPKWNPSNKPKEEESNPYLDTFQLILDFVGLVPGFGDIADIINAAISFGRGNYLDGFLSLIGAIPVVGSALMLPVKLTLKAFSKAGDVVKTAWKTGKSADEVWLFLKNGGKLDKKQLDMLAKGMGDAADYVTSFRKAGDAVLPDAAVKGLDDLAGFLKTNADKADEIFSGAAEIKKTSRFNIKDVGSILKAKKEVNTVTGLSRILGGRIRRRLVNLVSTALSPKELEALRGAMHMKFFRNMDNPGKLTALMKTTPGAWSKELMDSAENAARQYFIKMPKKQREVLLKGLNSTYKAGGAKRLELQLEFLRKHAPEVYQSAYKKIVAAAQEQKNPLYRDFMENEINALGSYFSKDYVNLINWDGVMARLSNLVPVIWNELQDVGEDIKMEMGLETQDDVNGLFWPLIKSTIGAAENIGGGVGDTIKSAEDDVVRKTIQTVPKIPIVGNIAKGIAGPEAGAKYDPNVEFEIVPDENDPRLQQQTQSKKKAIEKRRSWF